MAMYHFHIKSDKKPNGTKISAVQHVEYINREGKFSTPEQWQEKNNFVGDFISSEKFPNAFDGQNFLLYKTDDYGSIRNSQRGIEVTQNASDYQRLSRFQKSGIENGCPERPPHFFR